MSAFEAQDILISSFRIDKIIACHAIGNAVTLSPLVVLAVPRRA